MLDEMTQQNASKFAIFYIYENPNLFFPLIISCCFIFSPCEYQYLWRHREQGIRKGENKVAENKK